MLKACINKCDKSFKQKLKDVSKVHKTLKFKETSSYKGK